jgi:hypothetical protein
MSLKDGQKDDIYLWMINEDQEFIQFMEMKDHHEGRGKPWKVRLNQEQQLEAAKQYTFHKRFWNKR